MEPRSRRQLWQFEKRAIGQEVASHGAPLLAQPRPEEHRGERTTEEAAHMSKVVDTGPWRETQGHVNETELHDGFELRVDVAKAVLLEHSLIPHQEDRPSAHEPEDGTGGTDGRGRPSEAPAEQVAADACAEVGCEEALGAEECLDNGSHIPQRRTVHRKVQRTAVKETARDETVQLPTAQGRVALHKVGKGAATHEDKAGEVGGEELRRQISAPRAGTVRLERCQQERWQPARELRGGMAEDMLRGRRSRSRGGRAIGVTSPQCCIRSC